MSASVGTPKSARFRVLVVPEPALAAAAVAGLRSVLGPAARIEQLLLDDVLENVGPQDAATTAAVLVARAAAQLIGSAPAQAADVVVVTAAAPVEASVERAVITAFGDHALLVTTPAASAAALLSAEAVAFVVPVDTPVPAMARLCAWMAGAFVTPSPAEYAMASAAVAARRSGALRGGLGAALTDTKGEVVVLGTAEVPKAGGGHYWDQDPNDARDHIRGADPAETVRLDTVERLLTLLAGRGGTYAGTAADAARQILADFDASEGVVGVGLGDRGRTFESLGRVVHAEMAVLATAARLGIPVASTTAYATGAPCRQCLRQLVCSGVASLIFLGRNATPPAFLADAVSAERSATAWFRLLPFDGFTPGAYPRAFALNKRAAHGQPDALRGLLIQAAQTTLPEGLLPGLTVSAAEFRSILLNHLCGVPQRAPAN